MTALTADGARARVLSDPAATDYVIVEPVSARLDRIEQRLVETGATVKRYRKPTFTKPAPVDLRHEIATECHIVIEALAD